MESQNSAKSWKTWVTVLLFVTPIGPILVWLVAPWSKRARLIATGLWLFINLAIIIFAGISLTKAVNPTSTLSRMYDAGRKNDIYKIAWNLQDYYQTYKQAPISLREFEEKWGFTVPTDFETKKPYMYKVLNTEKVCVVTAILSTKERFEGYCVK